MGIKDLVKEFSKSIGEENDCTSEIEESDVVEIEEKKDTKSIPNNNGKQKVGDKSSCSTTDKVAVVKEEGEEEEETCMICYEPYQDGEDLRRLMCMCTYHKSCIDKWLEHHDTCPIDRRNIINPGHINEEETNTLHDDDDTIIN